MTNRIKQPWIEEGYRLFAHKGPTALKVEVIARKVNKSKSSFYHHFADMEGFIDLLLEYHLQRSKDVAKRERHCKNINPDLIHLLLDVKTTCFLIVNYVFIGIFPASTNA